MHNIGDLEIGRPGRPEKVVNQWDENVSFMPALKLLFFELCSDFTESPKKSKLLEFVYCTTDFSLDAGFRLLLEELSEVTYGCPRVTLSFLGYLH